MNIRPLASSLGPLMFFTFDHLLCPAHAALDSCSVRTEELLHGGDDTHGVAGGTRAPGTGKLPGVASGPRRSRVRRALSAAAAPAAMPFKTRTTGASADAV